MKEILLIEDDEYVNQNIMEILENENFKVVSAQNGKEGLEKIKKRKPDLIICDICMPELNGFDTLKILRNEKETARIPFIFLTARASMADLREGMNCGADDYLTKPFGVNDLIKAVTMRLQKSEDTYNLVEELKETFVKKIPHELRTPLIGILGFSELLKNEIESLTKEEILVMAEKISSSGKRLHRRIEKFLFFADLLSMSPDEINGILSPAEINEEYYKLKIRQVNNELGIKRNIDINLQASFLRIEESYYEAILHELVENAFKFSFDDNHPITITGEAGNEYYKTRVINYGKYLTSEKISRISSFNMFDEEKSTMEGNGLGLAIVKKIIELAGGYFIVDSSPDFKTKFEFDIPLAWKNNCANPVLKRESYITSFASLNKMSK